MVSKRCGILSAAIIQVESKTRIAITVVIMGAALSKDWAEIVFLFLTSCDVGFTKLQRYKYKRQKNIFKQGMLSLWQSWYTVIFFSVSVFLQHSLNNIKLQTLSWGILKLFYGLYKALKKGQLYNFEI